MNKYIEKEYKDYIMKIVNYYMGNNYIKSIEEIDFSKFEYLL